MQLTVNGKAEALAETSTVHSLIHHYGLTNERIAVEVNGIIIPRQTYEAHTLQDGDTIEVVRFVGGG